jgi:hypothetical protein
MNIRKINIVIDRLFNEGDFETLRKIAILLGIKK